MELSFKELLRRLASDVTALVRLELRLALSEVSAKGRGVAASAGGFVAGALFGVGAFAALTVAIVAGLATVMALWIAALLVAAAYGTIALLAVLGARRRMERAGSPLPERTLQSVNDDVGAIRAAMRRAR